MFQIGNHTYALHERKKGSMEEKGSNSFGEKMTESYRKMLMEDVLTLQNRLNETIYKDSRSFPTPLEFTPNSAKKSYGMTSAF